MRVPLRCCIVASLLLAGVPAHAQVPTVDAIEAEAAAVDPAKKPVFGPRLAWSDFFDPRDGQFDLSKFLAMPRNFLPVPVVVTEPAVGYGGGIVGMFLRPRHAAGDEGFARPDISAVGAIATENGTWMALAGDSSKWLDGRLRTLAGAATGLVNLDFYGLSGDATSRDVAVRYTLAMSGALLQANWQVAPKSPWAVGLRYLYAEVEPRLRDQPLFPNLADRVRVNLSTPAAVLEYDTRDSLFTPTNGIYAESSYFVSRESFGASVDFERFDQTLLGWHPVRDDVFLGARGLYTWTSEGTPFFMRPFVQLRGVPAMRYQGDDAGSVEVEARWQFHGRWSVVGFGGAGRAWTSNSRGSFTQSVGAGGAGVRYELASRFGMHVGIDVAASPGTRAVYLVVGNAWFRP